MKNVWCSCHTHISLRLDEFPDNRGWTLLNNYVTSEIAAKRALQVFLDALQLLPYQTWASLRPRDSREDDTTRTAIQSDTVTFLKVDELFETIRESEKEALTNIDGWCVCMRTAPEDELFKGRLAH